MRKLILSLLISFSFILPSNNSYAMDAKGKAFLVICTYGTVSGALLGFASMAFGTSSRAIAQGASLGLYAGIGFGSYVLMSHNKAGEPMEPEYNQGPGGMPPGYEDGGGFGAPSPVDGGGYGAPPPGDSGGGFFGTPQRFLEIQEDMVFNYKLKHKKSRDFSLPIYIPIVHTTF